VVLMIAIVAPPAADRPIAIVYPHEGNLRSHLKAAGRPSDGTPTQWASDPEVKKLVLAQLLASAKRGGLQKAEMIKDVIMTKEEWSVENGMLTASMKMARTEINKKYDKEIEAAYAS